LFDDITIVTPVKRQADLERFKFLESWVKECTIIIERAGNLSEARKRGINKVETPFTLNLDVDCRIDAYVLAKMRAELLKDPRVAVVALDFEQPMGHLGFGCSLWRTTILKDLYNWKENDGQCECLYMWNRVKIRNCLIETIPERVKHLRKNVIIS